MKKSVVLLLMMCVSVGLCSSEIKKGNKSTLLYASAGKDVNDLKIFNYIRDHHKILGVKKIRQNNKDLYLYYQTRIPGAPVGHLYIDSTTLAGGKDAIIQVLMRYKLPKLFYLPASRKKLLELCNQWMSKEWIHHSIVVDKNDLWFKSSFYLSPKGSPIPAEFIYRALMFSAMSWSQYYKELQKNFDMPKVKIVKE